MQNLEAAITSIEKFGEFLEAMSTSLKTISAALSDAKAVRLSVKEGKQPGDFHEFTEHVRVAYPELADRLETFTVERFDMSRLTIIARDDDHARTVSLWKGLICSHLEDLYGVAIPFRVRIPR